MDFVSVFGPVYRQIIDNSNMENSIYINSPGQSGNILSKNYNDLLPLWIKGEYLSMKTNNYINETTQTLLN
jgi:penicillin amidase